MNQPPRVIYKGFPKSHSWARWSTFRVKRKNNSTNVRFVGDTGCQPAGSKVLMANGEWKKIEDIIIGDEVLSPQKDGTYIFSKVKWINNWVCNKTYNVVQKNRARRLLYSTSNNHEIPFYYKNKKREWIWKEYPSEIINKMYQEQFSHRIIGSSSFSINKFKNRNNCLIEPYSLGVFLGDGMYQDTQTHKQVNITSKDFVIISKISKYYPIMSINKKHGTNAKSYSFSINSKFSILLKKYGLNGKKSGDKFIPKDALLSNLEYRKKLFAGLIDTDGSYEKGSFSFTLKSKQLIDDIRDLVYSIGGRCGEIRKVKKSIKSLNFKGVYYSVCCYLGNIELPIALNYKKNVGSRIYLEPNRVAITTKKSSKKRVYGFELDSPSHWYITDNWMITKNSGKSWSALSFCEMCAKLMKKSFTEKNVYFSIRQVLDEISENEPKAGTIFLIDEQQVEANAKDHQSRRARAYSLLLSTIRSNRYIIVTTLPFSDMELKSVRRFFHVEVETHGADLSTNTVRTTPRYLEYSRAKAEKVYRKRLIISYTDPKSGITHNKKVSFWDIPKASQELIDSYEINKTNFKRKLYKRLSMELTKDEGEDNDTTPKAVAADAVEGTLTDYQKGILKHMRNGIKMQKDISLKLAEDRFTSTPQKVSQNVKWMRKKGVVIIR